MNVSRIGGGGGVRGGCLWGMGVGWWGGVGGRWQRERTRKSV